MLTLATAGSTSLPCTDSHRSEESVPDHFLRAFSQGRQMIVEEQWSEAVEALQEAVMLRPEVSAVRTLLGVSLLEQGRPEAAVEHLRQALAMQPEDLSARLHLGLAAYALGELEVCESALRQVVARRPDIAIAWKHIVAVRHRYGKLAIPARTRLTELLPEDPDVWAQLGEAWMHKQAPLRAIACFRRALAIAPGDLASRCRLGLLLIDTGEIAAAERELHLVLAERPGSSSALTGLARIRSWRRDDSGARALIAPLITQTPPVDAAALWAELSSVRPDEALPVLVSALAQCSAPAPRSLLLHRLGDVQDALGETEAAFAAWQEANHIRPARFSPSNHDKGIDLIIDAYSQPVARSTCSSSVPVFVVGMPRSGTSLLEQMLDRHPQIAGAGELEAIRLIAQQLSSPVYYSRRLAEITAKQLTELAQAHLTTLQKFAPGAAVVIDKMPDNLQHLGLIYQLFPKARVLHITRDPVDTCFSCFRQRFGAGLSYTQRLSWLGSYYRSCARLMHHWQSVLPLMIHSVRYEQLVTEPEQSMRSVLAALGLEWDARVLSPHRSDRLVTTASRLQVQEPLHTRAVGRAAPYHAHLAELRAALRGHGSRD